MSILSEPIIQLMWIMLLLLPRSAISSGVSCAVDEAFCIALPKRDMAGGVLVEQGIEEQKAALRDRRGMGHQRDLAQTARAASPSSTLFKTSSPRAAFASTMRPPSKRTAMLSISVP